MILPLLRWHENYLQDLHELLWTVSWNHNYTRIWIKPRSRTCRSFSTWLPLEDVLCPWRACAGGSGQHCCKSSPGFEAVLRLRERSHWSILEAFPEVSMLVQRLRVRLVTLAGAWSRNHKVRCGRSCPDAILASAASASLKARHGDFIIENSSSSKRHSNLVCPSLQSEGLEDDSNKPCFQTTDCQPVFDLLEHQQVLAKHHLKISTYQQCASTA